MKKIILLISVTLLLFTGCQKFNFDETFSIEPLSPTPSQKITVKFLADETKLSDAKSIDMVVYQYDVDLLNTTELPMEKIGKGWVAYFTPDSLAKGLIITFKNDDIIENNNSTGYIVYLNDSEKNILPEAIAGNYVALSQWGTWYVGLKSDNVSTSKKFEDVFSKYPEVKKAYLDLYFYTLSRIGTKDALDKMENELKLLKGKEKVSENDLIILAKYSSTLKNDKDVDKYEELLLKKYPDAKYVQEIDAQKMSDANSADELKKSFDEFRKKYPNSELNAVSSYRVIRRYIDDGNVEGAINTADELKSISHPYAYIYATNKLIAKEELENALKLATIGVEATQMDFDNPTTTQPNYLSKKEWDSEREQYLAEMLKFQASVLSQLGKSSEALKVAEKAESILEGSDVELNEIYSTLLVKSENYKKAMEVIEKYLKENKSSSKMLESLKTSYVKINGSDVGYDEYVYNFSAAGKAKMLEELKSKMIDEAAPDFSIKDINGNIVKFADYKGKTVIVDFWATWCGPCKRSFPAMQEANDKFKDDDNIQFLFVNAWERVDNKVENATKFIKDNGYNLKVLMDVDNEVISKFKVTGIPTKFIIGPDQNIKFKSVGFGGTNEELVVELSAMIKLASGK